MAPSRRAQAASSQDVSLGFLGRERECVIVRDSDLPWYLRRQGNRRSSSRIVTTHVGDVTSDATTGAWTFAVTGGSPFFLVEYKTGGPDKAGTSVNTLVATRQ